MGEYLKRNGRLLLAAVVIVLFCAALPGLFAAGQAIETGSWGLSFRAEGKEPVGNASKQALQSYDAVYVGDGTEKVIYLTFDAGFENGYTASILDTLQAHNVPACFFVVGNYLETAPDLVRRMVNEGHIVGNHTYHHYDMSKISDPASFRKELSDVETLYEQTTGEVMKKYYRPPQGILQRGKSAHGKAARLSDGVLEPCLCRLVSGRSADEGAGVFKLLPRIHPGAVVLLHSTSRTNAEILDELLTKWETMGYRFASLDELYEAGA